MARKGEPRPARLVAPASLLDLSFGDMLLGLAGERPVPASAPSPEPLLRIRLPDGRVEDEVLLGGFWRQDRAGGLGSPKVVTLHHGIAPVHKLYRVGDGVAAYAGTLAAGGVRAFTAAAPGAEFKYRNARLRRMTADEIAAVVEPARVYDFELLGEEG